MKDVLLRQFVYHYGLPMSSTQGGSMQSGDSLHTAPAVACITFHCFFFAWFSMENRVVVVCNHAIYFCILYLYHKTPFTRKKEGKIYWHIFKDQNGLLHWNEILILIFCMHIVYHGRRQATCCSNWVHKTLCQGHVRK